jgi:hypothetical protein
MGKRIMENEEIYFLDLPDEEYAERVGDAIDELIKQGILSPSVLIEAEELNEHINTAIELAAEKYNKEKGYN